MNLQLGLCVICVTLLNFVQVNAENATNSECQFGQMKCLVTGKCIPLSWKCDDDNDCGENDTTDEDNCPPKTCASEEFRCSDGACVPNRWTCDGDADCEDSGDEAVDYCVSKALCTSDEFTCGDGTCISLNWKCDGGPDCEDGSDENNCTVTCGEDQFSCASNGQCISNAWVCDGDPDCLDESDEVCNEKTCKENEFKCADETFTRCIDKKWLCDGDYDCSDHSDEPANCTTDDGTVTPCSSTEFQCLSGECIHTSWHCDGDTDCLDGSDEGNSQCNYTCDEGQFQCLNHVCISNTLRCDHNDDCIDGSDELNCTAETTCMDRGEFDCYGDGLYCIANNKVCDGIGDCQHREDENPAICPHHNPCDNVKCGDHSHCEVFYNKTAIADCRCDRGFEWHAVEQVCKDIDECQAQGTCSQTCVNTKGGFKCECLDGYVLESHHFCRAEGPKAWLYYANRRDIRRMSVDSRYMEVIVEETTNSIALDYDYSEQYLFWTDGGDETIKRAKISDGSGQVLASEILNIHSNTGNTAFSPDGIAVDWVYKNVYWTDTGADKIKTANYDGTIVKTIISTDLDDPRAVCVDPEFGMLYWSDWGAVPKIERAGMDGSNRQVIVNQHQELEWPNGLTIDFVSRRIYWIDSKLHKIGSANMDGTDHRSVLVDASEIQRPFSISVFEDSLYWTDWHSNKILSVHKVTGHSPQTLSLGSYSVMDIKVYHPMKQDSKYAPAATKLCQDAHCEELCLPKANMNSTTERQVVCACDDKKVLNSDGKTCSLAPSTQAPPTTKAPASTAKPTPSPTGVPTEIPTGPGYTVVPVANGTESNVPHSQDESNVGTIAAIVGAVVLVVLILVIVVGFIILRKYKARSKKSMNFDNPVYRKTTTSAGEEQCMITDDHIQHPPHLQRLDSHENV